MTRIAVLSDIHGNILALDAVIEDLQEQGVDMVVFLGDLIMTGPRPVETLDRMTELNPSIWLRGNTDDWPKDVSGDFTPSNANEAKVKELCLWALDRFSNSEYERLYDKPIVDEMRFGGKKLVFCHGTPDSYSVGLVRDLPPEEMDVLLSSERMTGDVSTLFCGHTHRRFVMRLGSLDIVNFGSFCIPGEDQSNYARYGIVELRNGRTIYRPRDVVYDFDAYLQDMKNLEFPGRDLVFRRHGVFLEG